MSLRRLAGAAARLSARAEGCGNRLSCATAAPWAARAYAAAPSALPPPGFAAARTAGVHTSSAPKSAGLAELLAAEQVALREQNAQIAEATLRVQQALETLQALQSGTAGEAQAAPAQEAESRTGMRRGLKLLGLGALVAHWAVFYQLTFVEMSWDVMEVRFGRLVWPRPVGALLGAWLRGTRPQRGAGTTLQPLMPGAPMSSTAPSR